MSTQTSSGRPSRWPFIVAGLTIFAAVGVVAVGSMRNPTLVVSRDSIGEPSQHLEGLVARIERIEQRLDTLENPLSGPLSQRGVTSENSQGGASSSNEEVSTVVFERLARLEEIEQRRQEAQRQRAEQRRVIEEARRAERAQLAATAVSIMVDPTIDDQAKTRAWANIRMNARDAWTDEIVAEAVRIGTTSQDPRIRADVWRQAHANHTHPMLLQPLLQAVANDPDNSVREEAAETLDLYLDQPGVREALQFAAEYDANPGVRRQATISIAGPTTGGF